MALPPPSEPTPWSAALDAFADMIETPRNATAPPRLPAELRPTRPRIEPAVRALVFARDGSTCRWCGIHDRDWQKYGGSILVLDHVMPFSRGGCSCSRNLRALCWWCNEKRSDTIYSGDRDHLMLGVVRYCDTCQVDPWRLNVEDDTPLPHPLSAEDREHEAVYCGWCGVTSTADPALVL